MTDWSSHCLLLKTHKSVFNLFFDFLISRAMGKIVLLWTFEISVCLVYGYLCHFRLEPFKTLQSNASAL